MSPVGLQHALDHSEHWERHHLPTMPVLERGRPLNDFEAAAAGRRITDFAGCLRFVHLHTAWFGLWILLNSGVVVLSWLGLGPWDPYPFGLLTLVVSLQAIFLLTFVMIAQNR
jgi:uncharacterized membrane protein